MAFHNLKNYDTNLIMQELGKFNFKINITRNGLEKYMSSTINNKLRFIDTIMEKIFEDSSFPFPIKQCCVTFTRIYILLPFHNIVNREGKDKCL